MWGDMPGKVGLLLITSAVILRPSPSPIKLDDSVPKLIVKPSRFMDSFNIPWPDLIGDDVELDEAVMQALPPGCRVLNTRGCQALWNHTLRIEVELPGGTELVFFKKGATGPDGLDRIKSSFESETALHSFIPEYVPKPVAHGSYRLHPNRHFYIAEYIEMDDMLPYPEAWAEAISALHRRSMGKSPEGKFGFHVNTYFGTISQNNAWTNSWENLWAQIFRSVCVTEEERCGPHPDLARLKTLYHELVIPRYLRPLESDGRVIHPTLLHNDAWPGNAKPRSDSLELCLFGSSAVWGHNEGASEPQWDFNARIEVYATLCFALHSAQYWHEPKRRKLDPGTQ
ncbi:hypothetical protein VTJ49DRAFT_5862 [Mycothermus thermophilus]|uniref:protein-ribulosamine 3-kinase n=1 Tax=Humicola insolens TaxID=85995 RepID=A0ABR3V2I0_HUMIN